jgi:peptidoglycan/LPS O-acetylase OafA/YrhL
MTGSSRVALLAAVAAVALWSAKAMVIGVSGLSRNPAEDALFFLGLAAALVGSAALGAAQAGGRSRAARVAAAAAGVLAVIAVAGLTQAVVTLVQPADPSWVWGELNLWVAALALVTAAAATYHRQTKN